MSELRVLLSDDHAMLRQGLKKVLEERRDWRVIAEAGNGHDAVHEAMTQNPTAAVLDIGMPLLNGLEATRQIVRHAPSVRVLILSMHSDQACVTAAVQAGIAEFLTVSPAIVETHRVHILHKLGLRSTVEVVRYTVRRGIVH
jgi:DNA-binding NarL/FixJ family response regulator